jgi:hypothetical protein
VSLTLNMESAQLVVGAAILDPRYCRRLLDDREGALRAADRLAVAPAHVRLSPADRRSLAAIPASSLTEFARGIERLRRTVPSTTTTHRARRPVAFEEALAG